MQLKLFKFYLQSINYLAGTLQLSTIASVAPVKTEVPVSMTSTLINVLALLVMLETTAIKVRCQYNTFESI